MSTAGPAWFIQITLSHCVLLSVDSVPVNSLNLAAWVMPLLSCYIKQKKIKNPLYNQLMGHRFSFPLGIYYASKPGQQRLD